MSNTPDNPLEATKKPLSPKEISDVFFRLGLQKEEDREKFRSLAEAKKQDDESVRIFLSGTTRTVREVQGGRYA
jgi:hypothetical protein